MTQVPEGPNSSINSAPTLAASGPANAHVGVPYEFLPTAQDVDGDALVFSAENLPPWASIDGATGRISGTPAASDAGEYESIIIRVADGSHVTRGAPFNITVAGAGTGVAELVWQRPVSKMDGSPLDDLAGYRIIYGHDSQDLDHSIFVDDPNQLSYQFVTLESGVWYFAVVAVSASGLEGPATLPAMKTI